MMEWFNILRARLRALFRRESVLRDIEEELRIHVEMETETNIKRGMPPDESRAAALKSFGNLVRNTERGYDIRGGGWLETLWQDLRYGARMLMKRPGFTLVAVITLALGIGATTAIFSVINTLILKPLPYREPERLMKIFQLTTSAEKNDQPALQAYPRYQILCEQSRNIADVAAYALGQHDLTGTELPERLQMEYASASYFPLLGINAIVGRTFAPEEDVTAGTHPVALISYMLWQRRFGGDPNVIGKTIELDKHPLTIIGVLPSGFKGQSGSADVWTPTMMAPTFFGIDLLNAPYANWLETIIRLKPGVTQEQAQFALSTITANIEKTFPSSDGPAKLPQFRLKPLQEAILNPGIRRMFLILLGAVGFVMLIVCANLTNLTLGDVVTRRKEVAVRMALGASRGRIACQLLTESILMTSIGGALALLVANWGIDLLIKFRPGGETEFWTLYARTFDFFNIRIDGRVLAFNFLLALVAGILFGLIPAARLPRLNVNESLKNIGGRSAEEWRLPGAGMRNLLVVVEIALSVVLLIGAGLMMRSLTQLRSVNLGFVPQGVMVLRLGARKAKPEFFRSLLARTEALPGVELASVASGAPLMGKLPTTSLVPTGQQQNPDVKLPSVSFRNIAPNFFKTLGISFLKGRSFTEQDRIGTQRVAIINAAAATAYWPGQDPIGKRFELGLDSPYPNAGTSIEVIGVVDNAKYGKIEDAVGPDVYLPYLQPVIRPSLLIVRGNIAPAELITVVRRETRQLDRDAFVLDVKTMTERSAELTSQTSFIALLLSLFAGVAMLLATISVYVAMAYVVSMRIREIAIRMALGAQPNDVIKMMLGGGITLVSFGLLAGLLGAWAATRVLKSQLYGISTTDPVTFIGVAGLLIGVALLACWVPVRRATKIDPLTALRQE